jgi:hypothetical protein
LLSTSRLFSYMNLGTSMSFTSCRRTLWKLHRMLIKKSFKNTKIPQVLLALLPEIHGKHRGFLWHIHTQMQTLKTGSFICQLGFTLFWDAEPFYVDTNTRCNWKACQVRTDPVLMENIPF